MDQKKRYLKISNLIAKEIQESIDEDEKRILQQWIDESSEHNEIYNSIKSKNWYLDNKTKLLNYNPKTDWVIIRDRIKSKSKTKHLYISLSRWAAIFILLFTIAFLINNYVEKDITEKIAQPIIQPGVKGAKLIMDDGRVIPLKSDTSFTLIEKDGSLITKIASQLNYIKAPENTRKEIFNTIKTEKGEEYTTTLADGTIVKLNAESEIKFPVSFIKNNRTVEVKGEVYFEVAHDKSKPFFVTTGKSIVKVLGTKFNIRAYDDEYENLTTLVDGSVSIQHRYDDLSRIELVPGDQASIITVNRKIKINKVDTDYYTAWTEGKFVFKNESLEYIIKQLQRWYDFEIEFANENLKGIRFGTRIDRYSDVNKIFTIMENTRLVNVEQRGNKFLIKEN